MAKRGSGSRKKGTLFEQLVARDLRRIFDPPELFAEMEKARPKDRAILIKQSRVHRGRQGEGAAESDVHVAGCPWWFELQHADRIDPKGKLLQSEWDAAGKDFFCVSICRQTCSQSITATMRLRSLGELTGLAVPDSLLVVSIDYNDFLCHLRIRYPKNLTCNQ